MENRPHQKPDYRLELIDNELILYHPHASKIFYCNPTASLIWHLCDGSRTGAEITAALAEAYPEAAETIGADVETTLAQFAEYGAVEFI